MATSEIDAYTYAVNGHIRKVGIVKAELIVSAEQARSRKRSAKKISIFLGILIAIVGVTLARVSASDIPIPGTGIPLREALSYLSALLGAAISLINERFDPAKLREREVALGDLIYKLGILEEDVRLKLSNPSVSNAADLKAIFDELRKNENILLEEAEGWKASVRRIVEAKTQPNNGMHPTPPHEVSHGS